MSAKQKAKHIADRQPQPLVEKDKGPSPDGLGQYKGRILSMTLIDGYGRPVARPSQLATRKNTPGKSSGTEVERSKDYFQAGTKVKNAKSKT